MGVQPKRRDTSHGVLRQPNLTQPRHHYAAQHSPFRAVGTTTAGLTKGLIFLRSKSNILCNAIVCWLSTAPRPARPLSMRGSSETARVHNADRRCDVGVAVGGLGTVGRS